jgi:TonB-dependent SusC/RagA subfamily outer membrane receptor
MTNFNKPYHSGKKNYPTMIFTNSKKVVCIMKLILFFSFMLTFSLFATSYSQEARINLDITTATTTKSILKMIEEQTEFRFFYNSEMAVLNQPVSVSLTDKTIFETLDVLFAQTSVGYRVLENNFVVLSTEEMFQQQITITGIVTDKDGEPLPGTAVMIKGTSQGTVTDANGAYSLSVPSTNVSLVFTSMGFGSQEILVGGQRAINVTLSENTRELEEVVVVGYGTQKKVNLTGAVEQIDSKQLKNRSVPSISHALNGKVAGLNIAVSNGAPGSTPSINLRGYTGLGVKGAPLVVIDGVQGGNLNNIEMNDVESISFLKDAASAAIYGSSAPYGVIIVNMKRGRAGKPLIT